MKKQLAPMKADQRGSGFFCMARSRNIPAGLLHVDATFLDGRGLAWPRHNRSTIWELFVIAWKNIH
jgi:hypothetical protein